MGHTVRAPAVAKRTPRPFLRVSFSYLIMMAIAMVKMG